jgi:hypothetical protein
MLKKLKRTEKEKDEDEFLVPVMSLDGSKVHEYMHAQVLSWKVMKKLSGNLNGICLSFPKRSTPDSAY